MSISVNGQSVMLPGFRFHPTEEELLTYYLTKKVASQPIDLHIIPDVDLNKLEPWDIQERCRIGSGPQNDWYLFSHKDKKYPTGTRTNRASAAGFWKATGRDKVIYSAAGSGRIGMRKTLVFYKGRAPHGHKSDWIMHEYRLDDVVNNPAAYYSSASSPIQGVAGDHEEGWVICKVFKKHLVVQHQAGQSTGSAAAAKLTSAAAMERSPSNCSSTVTVSIHVKPQMHQQLLCYSASDDDELDHILSSTTSCKKETKPTNPSSALDHLINNACPNGSTLYDKFIELQPLEHVVADRLLPPLTEYGGFGGTSGNNIVVDWDTLDQIAAYELNDLSDAASTKTNGMSFFVDERSSATAISGGTGAGDGDLWNLVRSASSLHADSTINNV